MTVDYYQEAKRKSRGNQRQRLALWQQRYRRLGREFAIRERAVAELESAVTDPLDPETGFKLLSSADYSEAGEILSIANNTFRDLDIEAVIETNKHMSDHAYKPQLLHVDLQDEYQNTDSAFFRFALRENLLGALSAYFGFVPVLYKINYWYSCHADSDAPVNSQMFHLDWDDIKTVRIFLYVTDVTDDQGPMVILPAADSRVVSSELDRRGMRYWRVSDEEMYSIVEPGAFTTLTGSSGSIAVADPSNCYHYGSRVRQSAKPRFLVAFWYMSPAAFRLPPDKSVALPYLRLASSEGLTSCQRMALGDVPKEPAGVAGGLFRWRSDK